MNRGMLTSGFWGLMVISMGAVLFQAPPSQLPVAYWNLDEASGAAMDTIGGLGSTTTGTVARLTTPLPAFSYGNSSGLSFSTANPDNYVSLGTSSVLDGLQNASYSISAWFRPASIPSGTQFGVVMKSSGDNEGLTFRDVNPTGGVFEFWHWSDPVTLVNPGSWSSAPVAVNTWHHVVGVWNSAIPQAEIWLDGAMVDARPTAATGFINGGPWRLGIANPAAAGTNKWQADGSVDDVRFYTYALTTNQVAVLFNGAPAPTGLLAVAAAPAVNLSWTAPPQAVAYTYNVGRRNAGSTGAFTILNAAPITGLTYADTTGTQGTAYEYVVYAVSVAVSGPSLSATATAPGGGAPPPPPPPPRTQKVGNEDDKCGCGTTGSPRLLPLLAGLVLIGVILACAKYR